MAGNRACSPCLYFYPFKGVLSISMPKPSASPRAPAPLDQAKLVDTVGYNLRRAYLRIQRAFSGPMEAAELRPADFATLVLITDNPGASQKELARALAIDPPNMATLLERLERRRLVTRERDPRDERARQLRLTPTGKRLISRTLSVVKREEQSALEVLSSAEQAELMRLLQKLVAPELR